MYDHVRPLVAPSRKLRGTSDADPCLRAPVPALLLVGWRRLTVDQIRKECSDGHHSQADKISIFTERDSHARDFTRWRKEDGRSQPYERKWC
jgi:hypothetical protein